MHLVGFIIRIYHDARSPERQISLTSVVWYKYILRTRRFGGCFSVRPQVRSARSLLSCSHRIKLPASVDTEVIQMDDSVC